MVIPAVGWWVGLSVGWLVSRSVRRSVCRSVGWSVGWSVSPSVNWLFSGSVGRLVSWSVGLSVCLLVGRTVERSNGRSVGRWVGRSVGRWVGVSGIFCCPKKLWAGFLAGFARKITLGQFFPSFARFARTKTLGRESAFGRELAGSDWKIEKGGNALRAPDEMRDFYRPQAS